MEEVSLRFNEEQTSTRMKTKTPSDLLRPDLMNNPIFSLIGAITVASQILEHHLKICEFALQDVPDSEFDTRWSDRSNMMGQLIKKLQARGNVFDEREWSIIINAKQLRNQFTHELTDLFVASLDSGLNGLIRHLEQIHKQIERAAYMVKDRSHQIASQTGLPVEDLVVSANQSVERLLG